MAFSRSNSRLRRLAHILAGFTILLHGLAKLGEHPVSSAMFLAAGLVFLSVAIFHHRLALRFAWIDTIFFSIEAILSFVIAYEYYHQGKLGLPYAYWLVGLFQVFSIYLFLRKKREAGLTG